MSMTPYLLKYYLRFDAWQKRRRQSASAPIELFYEEGEPYSELCLSVLPLLEANISQAIIVRPVPPMATEFDPQPDKRKALAEKDAAFLAQAYSIKPDNTARPTFSTADKELGRARQDKLKHYAPGMWCFAGEWFWGIDRLTHLQKRIAPSSQPWLQRDPTKLELPNIPPDAPLEFFFSFRSPYSYLALSKVRTLIEQYSVNVVIRPVLPMVMRGLPVPKHKRLYIVQDTFREAQASSTPFGKIADPVGAATERCLQLFPLFEDTPSQLRFLESVAPKIWAQGMDMAQDKSLQQACKDAGLDWKTAQAQLNKPLDLDYAESNRVSLFEELNLWGVPSFRLGELVVWGQDRVWVIEEALRRRLQQ